jgi:predicted anti-sigma-YlaC factor YlaD
MKSTHRHTLACREIYRHICENLDTDLESEQCREIREHIGKCDNCTAYLDSLKKTVYLYRTYPTPHVPARSRRKLIAKISLLGKPSKK